MISSTVRASSPLAGKTVILHPKGEPYQLVEEGAEFHVEDWYELVTGSPWHQQGTFATLGYLGRIQGTDISLFSNDVLYGKIGGLGYLVHISEIGETIG